MILFSFSPSHPPAIHHGERQPTHRPTPNMPGPRPRGQCKRSQQEGPVGRVPRCHGLAQTRSSGAAIARWEHPMTSDPILTFQRQVSAVRHGASSGTGASKLTPVAVGVGCRSAAPAGFGAPAGHVMRAVSGPIRTDPVRPASPAEDRCRTLVPRLTRRSEAVIPTGYRSILRICAACQRTCCCRPSGATRVSAVGSTAAAVPGSAGQGAGCRVGWVSW